MSTFRPFAPNPFHINAFTLAAESIDQVEPAAIGDRIESRRAVLSSEQEISIPAGRGTLHRVEAAELMRAQDQLCDPNRRIVEELFAPAAYSPRDVPEVRGFIAAHKLRPATVRRYLALEPLDASTLLVRGLPPVDAERMRIVPDTPPPLSPPPLQIAAAAMLVTARCKRG